MGIKLDDMDEPISEINITPFVDIILVVLIIFMIATPVIMNPGIKVNLPQASSGESTEPSKLSVSVAPNGEISMNGKITSKEELINKAKELVLANPDMQAIIAADKNTPHGVVIEVLDKIKASGVKKFAISTDKSVSGQ